MIEIATDLQTPVCLANERVFCGITFTNRGDSEETLAWAGAQVHCQAVVREDVVRIDTASLPPISPSTDTTFVPNRGIYRKTLFVL